MNKLAFINEPGTDQNIINITCIDGTIFWSALEDCQNIRFNFSEKEKKIILSFDRYCTDGHGFFVGYENCNVTVPLIPKSSLGILFNDLIAEEECLHKRVVMWNPSFWNMEIVPADDEITECEIDGKIVKCENCEEIVCEKYYPADEEFWYEYIQPFLDELKGEILNREWSFLGQEWNIRYKDTKEKC